MDDEKSKSSSSTELRADAETIYSLRPSVNLKELSLEETQKLIHELRVHQIELEMQNDELLLLQQELESSKAKYYNLYNWAPFGFLTLDNNGIIIEVNQTAATLFGANREDIIGTPLTHHIFPDDQDHYYLFQKKMFIGEKLNICELRFKQSIGKFFWGRIEMSLSKDPDGSLKSHLGISDISEYKYSELALQKNNKLESLALLAGGIAHDFNNLQAGIFGLIQLALDCCDKNNLSACSEHLSQSLKMFKRAKDLSNQLLTFSKGGAPSCKLQSILPALENQAKFALSGSNINLDCSFANDLWLSIFDENQVGQVVENLIINAKHAIHLNGSVKISANNFIQSDQNNLELAPGPYICITISDDGEGIDEKHIQNIFDPFFTTKKMGNGLGLSISYSIIKKHNGAIHVESKRGQGTTFTIYIPAASNKTIEEEPKKESTFKYHGKVLFIDDQDFLIKINQYYFEDFESTFVGASNGEEAIALFSDALSDHQPFDLVISDLTIPGGIGGKEIVAKLRTIDNSFTAIACSGYSNDSVMINPKSFGFDDSISKPYLQSDLENVLRRNAK